MWDEKKVSIRFTVFTPNLPQALLQDDSDRPICPQPPHILSTIRDVCGIVCALRAAFIAALSVRVAHPNGGGNLLEWIVCICPVAALLAFRLGTVISFRLGRGNPRRDRAYSNSLLRPTQSVTVCIPIR